MPHFPHTLYGSACPTEWNPSHEKPDHDVLLGGEGDDTLMGRNQHDMLQGDSDNDTFAGENGTNICVAGPENGDVADDTCEGQFGF